MDGNDSIRRNIELLEKSREAMEMTRAILKETNEVRAANANAMHELIRKIHEDIADLKSNLDISKVDLNSVKDKISNYRLILVELEKNVTILEKSIVDIPTNKDLIFLEKTFDAKIVLLDEAIKPIKTIVYGLIGLIVSTVFLALLGLIITQAK